MTVIRDGVAVFGELLKIFLNIVKSNLVTSVVKVQIQSVSRK